jgi:hypothetical protein
VYIVHVSPKKRYYTGISNVHSHNSTKLVTEWTLKFTLAHVYNYYTKMGTAIDVRSADITNIDRAMGIFAGKDMYVLYNLSPCFPETGYQGYNRMSIAD